MQKLEEEEKGIQFQTLIPIGKFVEMSSFNIYSLVFLYLCVFFIHTLTQNIVYLYPNPHHFPIRVFPYIHIKV